MNTTTDPPPPDASAGLPSTLPTGGSPVDASAPPPATPDLANPAGPWPVLDLTLYDDSQGLGGPILDASPDDAQNLWAAAPDGVYVLRPGTSRFLKFTAADGLHIGPFTDFYGHPNMTSVTAIAGGHANEVFVGYYGYEDPVDPYQDTEAQRELGNADKVTFDPSTGKITTTRYLFRCDYDTGGRVCWENRSPRRMIFAHQGVAAGHLYIGFNHGVSTVFMDSIGDHVHPEVWWHYPDGSMVEKLGEFYGLGLDAQGSLWVAGAHAVGFRPFRPVAHFDFVDAPWTYAFTLYTGDHSLDTPAGYSEDDSGLAVMPNGSVYFSSFNRGLTKWTPVGTHGGFTIEPVAGMPSSILDLAPDPDGTLWIVDGGGTLWRYDPTSGTSNAWPGVGNVRRVIVDTTVTPRALYVSMDGGLAVIRAK
jgi:hypothetical protein